ncbi:hypothetical protein LCGC14_1098230 [marine sediment metagenome]|uniref:Uncharacterized protein n=1 Tax=marine sediment metagenome TaxID=412755 RepID=A0A0F9MEQ8_9ZZZZ
MEVENIKYIKLVRRTWWRRLLYSPKLFVRVWRVTRNVRLAFNAVRTLLRAV